MSSVATRGGRIELRGLILGLLPLAGGLALGAVYAYSAFGFNPLLLPAAAVAGVLAAISLTRPEVGIAAALAIVPLTTFGVSAQIINLFLFAWALFLFTVALLQARGRQVGRTRTMLTATVWLYLAVAIVAFALSNDPTEARRLIRALLTGLLLLGAIALTVRDRRQMGWVLAGASCAALLAGGVATKDYLTGTGSTTGFVTDSGEVVARITAGFVHPNQLGGFLVLLVPLSLAGALLYPKARLLHAAAMLLAIGGIYASFSRGALMGLALVPFVFLRGRRSLLVVPVLALLLFAATPNLLQERFGTLTSSGSEAATRVDIWSSALQLWEQHPVTGVGLGGFPQAYSEARIPGKAFLPDTIFEPPPHAHNVFLQALAEEGIFGLVALLAVLAVALHALWRLRRGYGRWATVMTSGLMASLVAFLVHNQFDVTLFDAATGPYVWALLGLVAALPHVVASTQSEPAPAQT